MRTLDVVAVRGRAQQGLVSRQQLAAAGVSGGTLHRAVLRGQVHRVRPAVYASAPLPRWPRFCVTADGVESDFVTHVRAVLLSLGDGAAASGTTAACLRGWGLLHEPRSTVQVDVGNGWSSVRLAGVRAVQRRQASAELWCPRGSDAPLRVTSAVQTVVDCCALLPHLQAVVVVDSALRSGQVTLAALADAASALRGRRSARLRRALRDCDPESGSVLETVLRLQMVDAGLIDFDTQVVLHERAGRRVRRVDFLFRTAGVVIEADGARWHTDPRVDRAVDNRLAAAGWRVLRFTWSQVMHDTAAVLRLIRDAVQELDVHAPELRAA